MFYLAVLSASEHPVNIREIKTLIINFYKLLFLDKRLPNFEQLGTSCQFQQTE